MTSMNLMNYTWDEVQVALSHDPALTRLWFQLTECCIKQRSLGYYPNDFHIINTGSYKEAWLYTSPVDGSRYVVKLCSTENDTFEEARVLERALDAEVPGFVPTIYLPVSPEASYLKVEKKFLTEGGNDYYTDWTYADINYVAVQPVVAALEDINIENTGDALYGEELCEVIPALNGKKWFPVNSVKWLRDYSTCYGEENMQKFVKFVFDWGINDLHWGNIGYFEEKPVIFDWLS